MSSEDQQSPAAPRSGGERRRVIAETLRRIVAAMLKMKPGQIDERLSFLDLGADSIAFTTAVFRIEDEFQLQIPVEKFFDELTTLAALVNYIDANLPETTAIKPFPTGCVDPAASDAAGAKPALAETLRQSLSILENLGSAPAHFDKRRRVENHATTAAHDQSDVRPAHSQNQGFPTGERQRDVWMLSQISADGHLSNHELAVLRLKTAVEVDVLQIALQQVVDRHQVLRCCLSDDGTRQTVQAALTAELHRKDFSHLKAKNKEKKIVEWIRKYRGLPLKFSRAPLWRMAILKAKQQDYLLVLVVHHIVFDGLSFDVFFDELFQLYAATAAGTSLRLAPPMQFSEYLAREQDRQAQPAWFEHEKYWQAQLADAPAVADLPLDAPRPPVMTYRGAACGMTLGRALTEALHRVSRQSGVSLFMTLLAAYVSFLHRLTGEPDLIVAINLARRNPQAAESLLGYCSDMAAVRSRITQNIPFAQLLQTIKKRVLEIFKHQDYPFCRLYQTFGAPDPARNGLLTSMFTLQQTTPRDDIAEAALELIEQAATHSKMDFYTNVIEIRDRLRVQFMYNPDLFREDTVTRWMAHFVTLLGDIVKTPRKPVYDLSLLTDADRQQILVAWNSTRKDYPVMQSFAPLFEAQVRKTPRAAAMTDADATMTYREFNALANRIARAFGQRGIRRKTLVGLIGERDLHFALNIVALFKLGAAYVPLDLRLPARRMAEMVRAGQVPFIVMTSSNRDIVAEVLGILEGNDPQVLDLQDLLAEDHPREDLALPTSPDDLAYVMFTSGSTGSPKGARIRQAGMINHMYAKIDDLALTAADRLAHTAPQGFDISVWQYLAPLLIGAKVRIFPDAIAFNPDRHLAALKRAGISIYQVVPSMLRCVLQSIDRNRYVAPALPRLRWVVPTGEVLPPDLCRRWLRYYPHIPLLNTYGPTECSDDVAHHRIDWPPLPDAVRVPIGRPIGNTQLYVLDPYLNPVPIGVAGELYVGGVAVGLGYVNDAEGTERAFIPNPFQARSPAASRLYRTGDWARYLPDGSLEFVRRLDHQLKINGIRIEPAEVQNALLDYPNLQQIVVTVRSINGGPPQLVGYAVFAKGSVPNANTLRRFLRDRLPPYMIPHVFVTLEALPLNSSGKLDLTALPDPATAPTALENDFVRPRTELETYLSTIWKQTLKHDCFGVEDNIFDVTESLQAIQIAARIEEDLGIHILLPLMFHLGTIAEIARHIDQTRGSRPRLD